VPAPDPLPFKGIAVYQSGPYWRISYTGTILYLRLDRASAELCGRIFAKHFGVKLRVFD
jgi:hypothetical protein